MAGRDTDATWRSTGTLCRELDWSRLRLLHELRNGLSYRTYPPGHVIDWHHPDVERSLDLEASAVTITLGVVAEKGEACFVLGLDRLTVAVEVLPPTDAEVPLPAAEQGYVQTIDGLSKQLRSAIDGGGSAMISIAEQIEEKAPKDDAPKLASAQWAEAATRRLRDNGEIPEEATRSKAALARLLESEAKKDAKAGHIRQAWKASYMEDELANWGIWPLSSLK
jgi:hypothetical protein